MSYTISPQQPPSRFLKQETLQSEAWQLPEPSNTVGGDTVSDAQGPGLPGLLAGAGAPGMGVSPGELPGLVCLSPLPTMSTFLLFP